MIADVEEPTDDPPEEPVAAAPVAPVRLTPEEIYRRLLKSTVYVVAKSTAPAGVTPTPPPPIPVKAMPKAPSPKARRRRPPKDRTWPSSSSSRCGWGPRTLSVSASSASTSAPPSEVVVRDAKDASTGKWKATASTVKLEMAGSEYVGQVNGETIIGTARSKQGGVAWKFAVNRKHGATATPLPHFVTRTGTGVLVDAERRLVVTDLHVVGDAEFVEIAFPKLDEAGEPLLDVARYQSDRIRGQVVFREPRVDLALVQIEQLPPGVESLSIAAERVQANDVVHLVGNPGDKKSMWFYRPSKVRAVGEERWEVPEKGTKDDRQVRRLADRGRGNDQPRRQRRPARQREGSTRRRGPCRRRVGQSRQLLHRCERGARSDREVPRVDRRSAPEVNVAASFQLADLQRR